MEAVNGIAHVSQTCARVHVCVGGRGGGEAKASLHCGLYSLDMASRYKFVNCCIGDPLLDPSTLRTRIHMHARLHSQSSTDQHPCQRIHQLNIRLLCRMGGARNKDICQTHYFQHYFHPCLRKKSCPKRCRKFFFFHLLPNSNCGKFFQKRIR